MSGGDPELQTQIALLESPFGRDPDVRARERAAAWLLDNSERSYPVLLARARDGEAAASSVELLGQFGRADAVPVLVALLDGNELIARAAAQALAFHPDPSALAALRQGLASSGAHAVLCADALGARGDPAACPELRVAATQPDARLRYHAIQAAVAPKLGCLTGAELAEIEASDPDADVRDLAQRARAS
jgi:HEAT repeat protein